MVSKFAAASRGSPCDSMALVYTYVVAAVNTEHIQYDTKRRAVLMQQATGKSGIGIFVVLADYLGDVYKPARSKQCMTASATFSRS